MPGGGAGGFTGWLGDVGGVITGLTGGGDEEFTDAIILLIFLLEETPHLRLHFELVFIKSKKPAIFFIMMKSRTVVNSIHE